MRRLSFLVVLTLLGACSMTTPPASPESAPSAPVLAQPRLDAITSDLRSRGVTGEIRVISAEAARFANGALGCPQPGGRYTQAQVDGMRVVVEAGEVRYDYRFGRGDQPRLCEQPRPRPSSSRSR